MFGDDKMLLYNFMWIVLIYGFLGWCGEVAFAAVKHGKFVNRGFLNGPICPIYGFGVLIVTVVLNPIANNIPLLFVGSVVFTSLLEFITGFILEQLFHEKWWDYSNVRFNIKGYICLRFSLLWGVAATLIVLFLHPSVMWLVGKIPFTLGIVLLCVLSAAFIADLVFTLIGILGLPKRMRAITEVELALRKLSDDIGEGVANTVFAAQSAKKTVEDKSGELKTAISDKNAEFRATVQHKNAELAESLADKRRRLDELKAKYAKLTRSHFQHRRIMNAFPNLQNGRFKSALEKIRERREK